MTRTAFVFLSVLMVALVGCKDEVSVPQPMELTREAIGHYCNMIVNDHPGPKIQVHEKGRNDPIWFSSVRDGLAYLQLPGEAHKVTAVYVHDMGQATNWERPQDDGIWINAKKAVYVIGSTRRGGMGAKETVPFLTRDEADAFAKTHGGTVVSFTDIPKDYLIGDDDEHNHQDGHKMEHQKHGS